MSLFEEEINDDNLADNIEQELEALKYYLEESDDAKLDLGPEVIKESN